MSFLEKSLSPQRVETMLLGAAFAVPFCSIWRFPPDPAFWGEWLAVALFSAWLTLRLWPTVQLTGAMRATPWSAAGFVALGALIVVQVAMRLVRSVPESLVAVVVLLLAAASCIGGTTLLRSGRQPAALKAVAVALVVAMIANAVFVVLGWIGIGVLGLEIIPVKVETRAVGLIGQANHLGTLAVIGFFAAAYLRRASKCPAPAFFALALVAGVTCAASGSRTALLEWLLACALWVWHARASAREASSRLSTVEFLMAAAVFGVIQIGWAAFIHDIDDTAISIVRTSTAGRYELLRDGLLLWLQHPVLGVGYGNFAGARLFDLTGNLPAPHADHAHDLFVQAMAEWGAIGLVIVVAMVAVVLRSLLSRRPGELAMHHGFTAAFVLCLFVHSLVEHPLWFPNFLLPCALMIGMLRQPVCLERQSIAELRRPAVLLAGLCAVAVCAVPAADYARLQRLAVDVSMAYRKDPKASVKLPLAETMRVAAGTLFPVPADLMLIRAMDIDSDFAPFKLEVATRALRAVPSGEMLARYALSASLAGKEADAQAMLDGMKARNRPVYDQASKFLSDAIPLNPVAATAALPAETSGAVVAR